MALGFCGQAQQVSYQWQWMSTKIGGKVTNGQEKKNACQTRRRRMEERNEQEQGGRKKRHRFQNAYYEIRSFRVAVAVELQVRYG